MFLHRRELSWSDPSFARFGLCLCYELGKWHSQCLGDGIRRVQTRIPQTSLDQPDVSLVQLSPLRECDTTQALSDSVPFQHDGESTGQLQTRAKHRPKLAAGAVTRRIRLKS